ncbi:GNAT family N-acetyltransferase [Streptomyces triticirhizae]|uniref:GNAT family N-acetyltransferase n=1 Tax=Streptomyces triticirhizae TaxID=2483353 RepID=UPI0026C4EDEF|nr:GNAT family N-acetyltransferase [Streptomyces triticirhizae]
MTAPSTPSTPSTASTSHPDGPPAGPVAPLAALVDGAPMATVAGTFRLEPVRPERDLPLLSDWMNDPVVDAFWQLAGPPDRTAEHLSRQLVPGGHSLPCLGLLDGRPMSYWEIYRADLDPLAAHYPAQALDLGVHLAIGPPQDRGRGLGSALLRAVAQTLLARAPGCARVLAEPDVRNLASIAAFRAAGFRKTTELELPDKRAALLVRRR